MSFHLHITATLMWSVYGDHPSDTRNWTGTTVCGPFVKMVVPCRVFISQPFLTSQAAGQITTTCLYSLLQFRTLRSFWRSQSGCGMRLQSISQPALMSAKIRLIIDLNNGTEDNGTCSSKETNDRQNRIQQSGCEVCFICRSYHSQLCWLLSCNQLQLQLTENQDTFFYPSFNLILCICKTFYE